MMLQLPIPDGNPFAPILVEIARHGENTAPIPVASAYEMDEAGGHWSVDIDVRILGRISFDCTGIGATLEEAIHRALYFAKRELPKVRVA